MGTWLLPEQVGSATTTSPSHFRILVLLRGLQRPGNTDGATLSICCLSAGVSLAWTALCQSPFSGMTSFGCVLDRTTRRRCRSRRFRPAVSLLLLQRLVLSRSCLTLPLPWAVYPLGIPYPRLLLVPSKIGPFTNDP